MASGVYDQQEQQTENLATERLHGIPAAGQFTLQENMQDRMGPVKEIFPPKCAE
jgi:hypothetical protein